MELGFGDVTGLDRSEDAIRWCREKQLPPVERSDLCALPRRCVSRAAFEEGGALARLAVHPAPRPPASPHGCREALFTAGPG